MVFNTRSGDLLPRRSHPGDACSPSDSPSRHTLSQTPSRRTPRGGNGGGGDRPRGGHGSSRGRGGRVGRVGRGGRGGRGGRSGMGLVVKGDVALGRGVDKD
eukprot:10337638-Ditylum_brightwellii.AAC.1